MPRRNQTLTTACLSMKLQPTCQNKILALSVSVVCRNTHYQHFFNSLAAAQHVRWSVSLLCLQCGSPSDRPDYMTSSLHVTASSHPFLHSQHPTLSLTLNLSTHIFVVWFLLVNTALKDKKRLNAASEG